MKMEEGKKQIAFKCDAELATAFRILCLKEDKSLKEYMQELMRDEIQRKEQER